MTQVHITFDPLATTCLFLQRQQPFLYFYPHRHLFRSHQQEQDRMIPGTSDWGPSEGKLSRRHS